MRFVRLALAIGLALLPSPLKIPLYRRFYGYSIGRGVRIGFSPFVGVGRCRIGDNVRIGSLNFFDRVLDLNIEAHVRIGSLNLFRGGERVTIGAYATILRLNVFNAIVEAVAVKKLLKVLDLGPGVFVGTGHWFDFTDGIYVGGHCVIGGRLSSFWTHNRQRAKPITVGCHTYCGSEIRVAPGAEIPAFSIVGLGAVVVGKLEGERVLIGGNPACVVRALREHDFFLVVQKTRDDLPDDLAHALLPEDLRQIALATAGDAICSAVPGSEGEQIG